MPTKIELLILDMHCVNCTLKLESLEDDLPGLLQVEANYRSQRLSVTYDPQMIDLARILEAVKAKGYHPEVR